jgi:glycosyltransferase involved in cell wall biosynthesis
MKIFFDHQTFSLQDYGGISRYYSELINAINYTQNNEAYLSLLFTDNVHIREINKKFYSLYNAKRIPKKVSIQYRLNKLYCLYELANAKFDVFHATYYDPYFVKSINRKPSVVTFLDMIHERYSGKFSDLAADHKITARKKNIADRVSAIIAISENTKKDLVELFDIDSKKIFVIPLGNSLRKVPIITDTNTLKRNPYLLFVGNRGHYKNFDWFIKAVSPLIFKYKVNIICAGGGDFTKQEAELLTSLRVQGKVAQISITDIKLAELYQNALAFVFPSLYEGFGLPILEAFACDCPCIVSNSSSLPEVAGDAALYIDPEDEETLIAALESLLESDSLRKALIQKGKERLAFFSWEKTAQKTLDLYRSL